MAGLCRVVAFALGAACIGGGTSAQTYTVTDLGTLGGSATEAHAINSTSLIVGSSVTASGASHAFRYARAIADLGINSSLSVATSVNASGQIGGYYYDGNYSAFVWTNGKLHDLGNLGLPYAVTYGINGFGHACGSSKVKDGLYGDEHAFVWTGGKMADLGTLGGKESSARGINSSDWVVGYAYLASGLPRAFLYANGAMSSLGTLGGDYSYGYAINDAGQVVGTASTTSNGKSHAFLWNGLGVLVDLGDLGDNVSEALALNPSGTLVVGEAEVPSNTGFVLYHAFVWSGGTMQDLNNLIPANSGWVLNQATGVNDAGVIVGYGMIGGQTHSFKLTPR